MSKLLSLVVNTVIGLMFLSGSVAAAETDNSTASQVFNSIESLIESFTINTVDPKELQCLARNIFFESGSESTDGKIAVGVVTLNRVEDPRWPKSVCEVVKQRTRIIQTVMVENKSVEVKRTVCQFSWACAVTARIKETDQRWTESLEVARNLLQGDHRDHKEYLGNILYFHATHVNPMWNNLKRSIRIGGHIFYVDKISNRN